MPGLEACSTSGARRHHERGGKTGTARHEQGTAKAGQTNKRQQLRQGKYNFPATFQPDLFFLRLFHPISPGSPTLHPLLPIPPFIVRLDVDSSAILQVFFTNLPKVFLKYLKVFSPVFQI